MFLFCLCLGGLRKWPPFHGSRSLEEMKIQKASCQMGGCEVTKRYNCWFLLTNEQPVMLQGDKSASQSSMQLYGPWIMDPSAFTECFVPSAVRGRQVGDGMGGGRNGCFWGRPDFASLCGKTLYFPGFWPKTGVPQKRPFLPPPHPIPQLTPPGMQRKHQVECNQSHAGHCPERHVPIFLPSNECSCSHWQQPGAACPRSPCAKMAMDGTSALGHAPSTAESLRKKFRKDPGNALRAVLRVSLTMDGTSTQACSNSRPLRKLGVTFKRATMPCPSFP